MARNTKLNDELPTLKEDDKKLKKDKTETEDAAQEAEKKAAEVGEQSDKTIKAAKEVMETAIAPAQGDKEAQIKAAQDVADKETAASRKDADAAKASMDKAVALIHTRSHELKMAQEHLDRVKKAAIRAKSLIVTAKGASAAWKIAKEGRRCLEGEDDQFV